MPFITQEKTNIKYILIIVVLAAIGGGGILAWQYWWAPSLAQADTSVPSIDISTEARQTYYQSGVPHTNKDGTSTTIYNPDLSFFPIGVFWVSSDRNDVNAISILKNAGFNTAMTARQAGFAETNPAALLNQIGTDDSFKLIIDQDLVNNPPDNKANPNSFNDARFQTYKNDSRVLGWWVDDEPLNVSVVTGKLLKLSPEDARSLIQYNWDMEDQVYQAYKDQTNQVFFITDSSLNITSPLDADGKPWFDSFMNLGDVASDYHYPKVDSATLTSFKETSDSVKAMVEAVGENKPAWFVPQAFEEGSSIYGSNAIYPTPLEERAQVYTSIIHGATGILHFTWDSCIFRSWGAASGQTTDFTGIRPNLPLSLPYNCPNGTVINPDITPSRLSNAQAIWDSLDASNALKPGINSELATLKPVILSPTSRENYSVFVDRTPISSAPIRTMFKYYNGEYYLLAVNIVKATINARFQFSHQPMATTVLFENNRQPTVQGNSIIDSFGQFAVHVYKFSPKFPPCYFDDPSGKHGYGDVTGDNMISMDDANLIAEFVAGLKTPTASQRLQADVNNDKSVSMVDATLVGQYSSGLISTFSICSVVPTKITAKVSGNSVLFRWGAQPNQGVIAVWPASSPAACTNVNIDVVKNSGVLAAYTSSYTWNGAPGGNYKAAFVQYVAGNTMPVGCVSFTVRNVKGASIIESFQSSILMISTVITNFLGRIF